MPGWSYAETCRIIRDRGLLGVTPDEIVLEIIDRACPLPGRHRFLQPVERHWYRSLARGTNSSPHCAGERPYPLQRRGPTGRRHD
jgi:hypothetical protein